MATLREFALEGSARGRIKLPEARTDNSYRFIEDGVVQLRFADEEGSLHALNAAEVAQVLQGVVEFTDGLAKRGAFGDGMPPTVLVRPAQQGSFVLEAVLAWSAAHPEVVGMYMGAGGVVVKSIDAGLKKLRGVRVTDMERSGDGLVKLNWSDGDVSEVPESAWEQLNTMPRKTRKALAKIMTPLGDAADRLELREAAVDEDSDAVMSAPAASIATRSDYREAVHEVDDTDQSTETFSAEASFGSIDFENSEKWRVSTIRGTRQATIEDGDFLQRIDAGEAIHKNDLFEVTIREERVTTNGRTKTDWFVVDARLTRRGDDDAGSSTPAAS
ncbi:hypothetical protein F1C15_11320 [Frigoribacterium sp. NBH87]|uniref:hypothetical protein n=1 Tax=Frigoribacterium sp. NBH87 TaxID=2596916 RepID=UPI00162501E4|nr:hypothetical protein [Frigoribacterium sp. NBH87]QNE44321.1 hypothetical protein F1C15_11320 [Frigoribacterium sp. NBH87]